MIKGIGTDIIEIERIGKAIERHGEKFLNKIFTEQERIYCSLFENPVSHYAARFAAKEAVGKALGCGIGHELTFQDICILKEENGKPYIELRSKYFDPYDFTIHLTMSHCQAYATAFVVIVSNIKF